MRCMSSRSGPHICHCRMCQKAFGSFFAPLTGVPLEKFELTRGELAIFKSSDQTERGFCRNCGTPLTIHDVDSPRIAVSIGSLDEPEKVEPQHPVRHRGEASVVRQACRPARRQDHRGRQSRARREDRGIEPPAPRPRHDRVAAAGPIDERGPHHRRLPVRRGALRAECAARQGDASATAACARRRSARSSRRWSQCRFRPSS